METEYKVGDIVVAINGAIKVAPLDYYSCRGKLIKDYKYTIAEITEQTIRVIDIENNYVRNSMSANELYRKVYLYKDKFITLEEWELNKSAIKYNL